MPSTRSSRKKQTQLGFAPLDVSSPVRQIQPEAIRERAAKITYSGSPSSQRSDLPTPKPSSQPSNFLTMSKSSPSSQQTTRSFMSRGHIEPTKPKSRSTRNAPLSVFDEDSESDSGLPLPAPSYKKSAQLTIDSDSDVLPLPSTARRLTEKASSRVDADSESDVQILSSARKRRKITHILTEEETEDEVSHPTQNKRKLLRPLKSSVNKRNNRVELNSDSGASSNSDASSGATPSQRKTTSRQKEDLDEDLEFLEDADNTQALQSAGRTNYIKTAKQQALEALRRKRHRRSIAASSPPRRNGASDEDGAEDEEDEDELEDLDDVFNSTTRGVDDDEEDFIIEDDTLGAPVELPFEFSQYATMKASDLFRYAVEWMVQKKMNPAFAMEDELYQLAFRRLDDTVKGLGGSKYQSSAWVPGFLASLKARPEIVSHQFTNDGILRDHCDACNRSNHPATWEVQFNGNSYDKETLEENSDGEEESDDDDDVEERRRPNALPPAGKRYYLGRFCMQNARTAHALAHWRFHLNEWVIDYLEEEGECTPEKIVQRDRLSTKKRRNYANKIVDKMAADGEIKRLHQDFKHEIEDAHERQQNKYDRSEA